MGRRRGTRSHRERSHRPPRERRGPGGEGGGHRLTPRPPPRVCQGAEVRSQTQGSDSRMEDVCVSHELVGGSACHTGSEATVCQKTDLCPCPLPPSSQPPASEHPATLFLLCPSLCRGRRSLTQLHTGAPGGHGSVGLRGTGGANSWKTEPRAAAPGTGPWVPSWRHPSREVQAARKCALWGKEQWRLGGSPGPQKPVGSVPAGAGHRHALWGWAGQGFPGSRLPPPPTCCQPGADGSQRDQAGEPASETRTPARAWVSARPPPPPQTS